MLPVVQYLKTIISLFFSDFFSSCLRKEDKSGLCYSILTGNRSSEILNQKNDTNF